ncbi:MAG: DUF72 domain-containing protein [Dehalococcoidia bacterium]|nr:MAG: DUF72 domain-containing protein [Dehalococcoidia bacterium]
MGTVRVGTCSWTDPTLVNSGRFYPDSARSAEARLQYYASQFNIVEVDSSYYAMPGERNSYLWAERTPDDFLFDFKAFRVFTQHPTPPNSLPKNIREELTPELQQKGNLYYRDLPAELVDELWQRFESSLLPLDTAGKLGIVLFQFPPWFYPGSQQLDYIIMCKERLPQYGVAIEFRNNVWLSEKNQATTLDLLRRNDLPFVCVDEPQGFKSSVPPVAEVTSDIGLVRFHGRNTETWEKKGIGPAERFNYLYSEEELEPWAGKIGELAGQASEMHVLFNNCHQDKAVVNARQISLMLGTLTRPQAAEE